MSKSISAGKTLRAERKSERVGFGARVFCGVEQFCRRSAKLSNIPCQLPAKLEMKFPFPGAAHSLVGTTGILIDTLSQDVWNWNEYLALRWDRTSLSPGGIPLFFLSGVESSWEKKREISSPGCCSAEWVLYHHLLYQMAVLTGWLCCCGSVLKERKLPAGKYFIISHSDYNLIKDQRHARAAGWQRGIELRVRRELNLANAAEMRCARNTSKLSALAFFYIPTHTSSL